MTGGWVRAYGYSTACVRPGVSGGVSAMSGSTRDGLASTRDAVGLLGEPGRHRLDSVGRGGLIGVADTIKSTTREAIEQLYDDGMQHDSRLRNLANGIFAEHHGRKLLGRHL
jgi:hypothetical protein